MPYRLNIDTATFAPACLDADLGAGPSNYMGYRTGSSVTGSYATNASASLCTHAPGTTGYAGTSYR